MKKTLVIVLLLISMVVCSSAESFSFRNGISYGDTMSEVEAKESFNIIEKTDTTLKTDNGTIASIGDSYIIYTFTPDDKLIDIYMDFGVHIGKPEQAISAYKTVYDGLVGKYGTPTKIEDDAIYVISGSAVDKVYENANFLSSIGLTPSLQEMAQWVLRYDNTNVKIDLLRYAPNGVSTKSISSDVIISYHFFSNEEEQAAIDALNSYQDSIQQSINNDL